MTPHGEQFQANRPLPAVARHDRVRVPDGRKGEVIGFYRDGIEHMLVLFDTGGTRRYCSTDLLRLGAHT